MSKYLKSLVELTSNAEKVYTDSVRCSLHLGIDYCGHPSTCYDCVFRCNNRVDENLTTGTILRIKARELIKKEINHE